MNHVHADQGNGPRHRSSGSIIVWILLLLFVAPLLVCGGLCTGIFMLRSRTVEVVQEAARESLHEVDAYRLAWDQVRLADEVTSRIGEPILDRFPSQYHYSDTPNGGNAEFEFRIEGPQGDAQVRIVGEKIEGKWWYETIDVTFEDGGTVELALDPRPIVLD